MITSWPSWLSWLCYAYFSAGILGSLFAHFAQKRFGPSSLFSHGKAAPPPVAFKNNNRQDFISQFLNLTLSKHLFWHFYLIGLLSCSLAIFTGRSKATVWLLLVQCLRRLIECFWVMPGARGSQMHLIHYLIGISYYPVLLVTFNLQSCHHSHYSFYSSLFIVSSLFQLYCHYILGSERSRHLGKHHRPINNPIFKFLHTPHYFAEFLIYFCIAAVNRFHPLSLMNLIWILTILGVSAKNSADWMEGQIKTRNFYHYLMIPFLF